MVVGGKLQSLNVDMAQMRMFYHYFIQSVFSFSMICWFGSLCLKTGTNQKEWSNCAIRLLVLYDLQHLYEVKVMSKGQTIALYPHHPLHAEVQILPSGRRFSLPKGSSNGYRLPFVPSAIGFLNYNPGCHCIVLSFSHDSC